MKYHLLLISLSFLIFISLIAVIILSIKYKNLEDEPRMKIYHIPKKIDKNDLEQLHKYYEKNYEIHESLRDLMKVLNDICKEHMIPYWIAGGTLLGQKRHKTFIPWDDDIDLNILDNDLQRLIHIVNMQYPNYEIKKSKKMKIQKFKKKGSKYFIDLISFTKNYDKFDFYNPKHRKVWPNGYFTEENLFPLKRCDFDGIDVLCPQFSLDYLDRHYGDNWKDVYKITHTHF